MKHKNTVDSELDAMLAKMPVTASADFANRVCEAVADEQIDALLEKTPVEPSSDFSKRVLAELSSDNKNTVAFPRHIEFFRAGRNVFAGLAAAFVACFGFFSFHGQATLSERVDRVVEDDPELAALAALDEEFSWNELLEVSHMLTALSENSEDTDAFFAYYEN